MDKRTLLRRIPHLLALSAKMDLAWLLRDAKYALITIFAETLGCVGEVGSIFLLAIRFDGVGEMSRYEVLFMLSYVVLLNGVFILFGAANNIHISRRIGRGQLEHMFIQPLPFAVQLTTEGFIPFTGALKLLTGGVVMAVSLHRLELSLSWWWLPALLGSVAVTFAITVCLSYLFSSAAFYAPVAAEEISTYVLELNSNLSQYPLSGMPRWIQLPLITLFPAGLMAWFPTMALLGKPPLNMPAAFPLLVLIILFAITQSVFRKGWKHYVKKGSNRYLPYGLRS